MAEKGEEHEQTGNPGLAELSPVWPGGHSDVQPRKSRWVWTAVVLENHTLWVVHNALMGRGMIYSVCVCAHMCHNRGGYLKDGCHKQVTRGRQSS